MNLTEIDLCTALCIALVIVAVMCILVYDVPKTAWWKRHIVCECRHDDACFECNESTCVGCEHFRPLNGRISQAYVKRETISGSVAASATLTFDAGFVISQHPRGGDGIWEIPDMTGLHKIAIYGWIESSTPGDHRTITFIPK